MSYGPLAKISFDNLIGSDEIDLGNTDQNQVTELGGGNSRASGSGRQLNTIDEARITIRCSV